MSEFRPITPRQAVDMVEAAGVPDARRLIIDHSAAGLIKAYALVIETVQATGERGCIRGGAVPVELWRRVVQEGAGDDVWTGGTVRLVGSGLVGGTPEVSVTGIRFSEKHLQRLIAQQGGRPVAKRLRSALVEPDLQSIPDALSKADRLQRRKPDRSAIPSGALLATVNQTIAPPGLGRTKVNELMRDGRLIRRRVDGRTLIEVESVRALVQAGG